jgi:arsenite methyltransferase
VSVDLTTQQNVQEYYGSTLQSSNDLKTNACTSAGDMPRYIKDCLGAIHPEVLSKYYGCGLCIPEYDLTDASVLDLGCGAGRDVYLLSQLVGQNGYVVGIDMTTQQLDVAKKHQQYHVEAFGHSKSNVQFIQGYLEQLDSIASLEENSFDVIVSNCVINLCTDKAAVLKACYKLLKPGGELYFSDVYSNRRVPTALQQDTVMWGECLSGALYWNDFHNLAKDAGFRDPRLVEDGPILVTNGPVAEFIKQSGNANLEFYSATYRLQKLDNLEPACEDYGQAVIYKGTIDPSSAIEPKQTSKYCATSTWTLDKHHVFEAGKIHPVCGNTWNMLQGNPKVAPHFQFIGNFEKHYGIFDGCGTSMP